MKKDKLREQIEEMTVDSEREELVAVDLLDVLLDPDNREPLAFVDDDGKVLTFEQVAVIPHDDKNGERQLFTVLKPLDKIEGVGEKRRADLLKHFKTIDAIKRASVEELRRVVPLNTAHAVYDFFHEADPASAAENERM